MDVDIQEHMYKVKHYFIHMFLYIYVHVSTNTYRLQCLTLYMCSCISTSMFLLTLIDYSVLLYTCVLVYLRRNMDGDIQITIRYVL
jgi:hypothetical protein